MPKVSILLPVYNTHPEHLKMAIDSIFLQTFSDYELLIYNDASTEQHVEDVVKSYNDPRIKYFHETTNLGISNVRNKLIELSTGQYLAVMDHDDLFLPTKLEKQIALMEQNSNIGVCGTAYKKFGRLFKNKNVIYPRNNEEIRAELFFKNVIHHPSCVLRKDVLTQNNIHYDTTYTSANDRKLFMDITEKSDAYNIPEVLCKYRMHRNMTSKTKRKQIVEQQKILRKDFLNRIGAQLSAEEEDILNNYALKGRTRIREYGILLQINDVLKKLSLANEKSKYFDANIFNTLCAKYLVKRCYNAAFYGRISSKEILEKTTLPIANVKKPFFLKLINYLVKRTSGDQL